jgi:hypothetical protein
VSDRSQLIRTVDQHSSHQSDRQHLTRRPALLDAWASSTTGEQLRVVIAFTIQHGKIVEMEERSASPSIDASGSEASRGLDPP